MKPRKTNILTVVFCLISLILSGCVPATPIAPTVTPMMVSASTNLPTATQPESTPLPPTPPPLVLNSETELIFTIRNDETGSPVMGTPWPDWLAWGAQAFTVAPDGSFWILDTTKVTTNDTLTQPRLLHYSPEGELVKEISLEGKSPGAVDFAVTEDKVWVWTPDLGGPISPGPTGQLAELDWNGQLLNTYEILWELIGEFDCCYPEHIYLGKEGELLLQVNEEVPFLEILDADGNMTLKKFDGYPYGAHLYKIQQRTEGDVRLFLDDVAIEPPVSQDSQVEVWSITWLGITEDGSFYVSAWEGEWDDFFYVFRAYSPEGKLLGISLPPENAQFLAADQRTLAPGPDGTLFALVSKEDHSVDILRLGFRSELPPPVATKTPAPTPTPLTPLLPAWTTPPSGATDLEIARETLLNFFTALHDKRYAEAVNYYGGDYGILRSWVDDPPNDYALLWELSPLQYFLVSSIIKETQIAPDEFQFLVEFMRDDGTRFYFSTACCGGNFADGAIYSQFPYTVKKIAGEMKVMEMPIYVP